MRSMWSTGVLIVDGWGGGRAADGVWEITLDATDAGGPYTIEIADTISLETLTNVMFGDVFLCSVGMPVLAPVSVPATLTTESPGGGAACRRAQGQSNMQMTVSSTFNASAEIADAGSYPNLRLFTGAMLQCAASPSHRTHTPQSC
jgi:hypothetical protein